MSDASLALQRALVERLRATPAVTNLVPTNRITVRPRQVTAFPCIHVGEGYTVDPELSLMRNIVETFGDLHVFDRAPEGDEVGFTDLKRITGAIRVAVRDLRFDDVEGWDLFDVHVMAMRFMHDPDGVTVHAVVTVRAMAKEIAS